MRWIVLFFCTFVLAGCANEAQPPVIPTANLATPELPATLSLPALMAAPERYAGRSLTLVAPVATGAGSRVLVPGTNVDGTPLGVNDGARSLWLAEPLPEQTTAEFGDGLNFLKLRGELSPPGAYGSDGRFPYQFSADTAALVQPERTTVANLAENPQAIDDVLLEVRCFILATAEGILLVDEVSTGGIPSERARQIKLHDIPDRQLLNRLQQSGAVRYGEVVVMGWWNDATMTAFEIVPVSS
jgi:hypothetical protein